MTTTTTARVATETEEVVASMLGEPTGRHMLDSGGAYGRNWERNAGSTIDDWRNGPAAWLDRYGCVTLSVFHWLTARVDYCAELDDYFGAWSQLAPRTDDPWLACSEEFAQLLWSEGGSSFGDFASPSCVNTYNGEDMLAQVLQYVTLTTESTVTLPELRDESGELLAESLELAPAAYVLLQIHGGCDVRGGYTRPRVFTTGDDSWSLTVLFDNADAELYCAGSPVADAGQMRTDGTVVPEGTVYHSARIGNGSIEEWYAHDPSMPHGQGEVSAPDGWSLWDSWRDRSDDDESDPDAVPCPLCGSPLSAGAPYPSY